MKKALIVILLLLVAAMVVLVMIPAGEIRFEGNEYYSEEELWNDIFRDEKPRYFVVRAQELLGKHREIPFIDHYELVFGPERSITVRLYERSLAGYLKFQDYYLYFDWSGTVVESSQQALEDVFEVRGLGVNHAVVGEKLPVADSSVIDTVLTISQFLRREKVMWGQSEKDLAELTQRIRFSAEGATIELEGIEVFLGGSDNMDAKLFLMADILPELAGRKGILYLDNYQAGAVRPHYIFKEEPAG